MAQMKILSRAQERIFNIKISDLPISHTESVMIK